MGAGVSWSLACACVLDFRVGKSSDWLRGVMLERQMLVVLLVTVLSSDFVSGSDQGAEASGRPELVGKFAATEESSSG